MTENKTYRYETDIEFSSSANKLNTEFALVDVLVCYAGKNRNRTSISKETIEKALPSLYGVPIVGEYLYKEGTNDFGTHGGKIVIDDNGIRYEETTKPYGFVPKDAVENAEWIVIKDTDNHHTEREYLKLKDCIVWVGRYDELECLVKEKRPQSMELTINNGHYDDEDYFVIDDFTYSALCILGTDIEPCFESACIGRFEYDNFKKEYSDMLSRYELYLQNKKEEKTMDFETIKSTLDEKYSVISYSESDVTAFNTEDYCVYTISFTVNEDVVTFDYENQIEKAFAVADKTEDSYNLKGEIENIVSVKTKESADYAINTANENFEIAKAEAIKEISEKYEALSAEYEALKAEKAKADERLNEYAEAEKMAEKEAHEKEIMDVIDSYSQKLGSNPEYLMYKTKIDYSKTKEQVDIDMLLILGKADRDGKMSYSYNPVTWGASDANFADNSTNRYGNLFDKVKKD